VGTLHETTNICGIKKTALMIVGRVLGSDYELSKLYDRTFETAFRKAEK
jgi:precorrin-4/cobalt-precorrin-4 C11-methyltransferase